MLKLNADRLKSLGAPAKAGAAPIEGWLRGILRDGTLRLEDGLRELRGPIPIVTTLSDLKAACGVALETLKQGLRPLETDHWVQLVDGAHTRLLGPPRFAVHVSKENFWGSVSEAIEVALTDGLSPLESLDYDRLRQCARRCDRKKLLDLGALRVDWNSLVRLSEGETTELTSGEAFTLAAGSQITAAGRSLLLEADLTAIYDGRRDLRLQETGEFRRESGELTALPANCAVHLDQTGLVRLANGNTGIVELSAQARTASGQTLDWSLDTHWLSRFEGGLPLVLLRRAVYADLPHVVQENCAGVRSGGGAHWRVVLGFHDCIMDGTLPFRAGQCSLRDSPDHLIDFLRQLGPEDSLRRRMAESYGFRVEEADVRVTPAKFASAYDRHWLRQVAGDAEVNSEVLAQPNRLPCWTQIGAYYRQGDHAPWEITREVYFGFVQVRFRQRAGEASLR